MELLSSHLCLSHRTPQGVKLEGFLAKARKAIWREKYEYKFDGRLDGKKLPPDEMTHGTCKYVENIPIMSG